MSKFLCPYCKSDAFWRVTRVTGPWQEVITITDGKAEIQDTSLDSLTHGPEPKTLRCGDCKKRFSNPLHIESNQP